MNIPYKSTHGGSPKPFAQRWGKVNDALWIVAVLDIAFDLLAGHFHGGKQAPPPHDVAALFSIAAASTAARAVYVGYITVRGGAVFRAKNPWMFWLFVAFFGFTGLALLVSMF